MSKIFGAAVLTIVFIALLLGAYMVHVWYLPVQVVLYSAIQDMMVAVVMGALLLLAIRRRIGLNGFESLLLICLWVLGGYAFAISGPAVLDRSLSFYILEKLQQRGGGIRQDAIADLFVNEYMREFRLVDVRLTEQLQSGTIRIDNGCVRLTERGQDFASFSRYTRLNFLPKHRLLSGEYTDALVDPFAGSQPGPIGYEC